MHRENIKGGNDRRRRRRMRNVGILPTARQAKALSMRHLWVLVHTCSRTTRLTQAAIRVLTRYADHRMELSHVVLLGQHNLRDDPHSVMQSHVG